MPKLSGDPVSGAASQLMHSLNRNPGNLPLGLVRCVGWLHRNLDLINHSEELQARSLLKIEQTGS